jgi:hypothetical protein
MKSIENKGKKRDNTPQGQVQRYTSTHTQQNISVVPKRKNREQSWYLAKNKTH